MSPTGFQKAKKYEILHNTVDIQVCLILGCYLLFVLRFTLAYSTQAVIELVLCSVVHTSYKCQAYLTNAVSSLFLWLIVTSYTLIWERWRRGSLDRFGLILSHHTNYMKIRIDFGTD